MVIVGSPRDKSPRSAMAVGERPPTVPMPVSTGAGGWHMGLPTLSGSIDCSGARHRITWRRGKLVLEDHDILAEQSLAAFGGKPPMCLQVLEAWRAVRDSELLYELLAGDGTHARDMLAVRKATHEARVDRAHEMSTSLRDARQRAPMSPLERHAAQQAKRKERRWATGLIRALPPTLRTALALSVIVNAQRQWEDAGFRRDHTRHIERALTAIVRPLFERSARCWAGVLKRSAGLAIETALLAPGEEPSCTARADQAGARASLALPISWFTDVWARDIALVDQYFVMGLGQAAGDGDKLPVFAVGWEREGWGASRSIVVPALLSRGTRGDWRLHWT